MNNFIIKIKNFIYGYRRKFVVINTCTRCESQAEICSLAAYNKIGMKYCCSSCAPEFELAVNEVYAKHEISILGIPWHTYYTYVRDLD